MLGLGGQLIAGEREEKRVMLKEDFDSTGQSSPLAKRLLTHPHISLAKGEGVGGSNAIRVAYVGYARGSERVVVHFPLEGRALHATLSFDVKFDNDFQWVLGGKLHGLGPKLPITGGEQREPDGWSARIMFKKDGRCSTYLYDQDPTKKWGIGNTTKNPVFTAGQWSHVTLQVSLNDSGESNGWSRILIDNQEVVKTENVEFRDTDTDETLIQQFLFSTFHGGNQPEWSPVDKAGNPTTIYAWFDNFVVESGIQPGRFVGFD
jgi:hypothetical protein